jgi:ATPase subunit of ABC transporter with duplicated ATPase domains
MALLSLNDVGLTFAGPPLLNLVGLQIDDGERIGLLGRNGAGKSTVLRLLEGTLAPSGTIDLDAPFDAQSAGTQRRVLLAAAPVRDPDPSIVELESHASSD